MTGWVRSILDSGLKLHTINKGNFDRWVLLFDPDENVFDISFSGITLFNFKFIDTIDQENELIEAVVSRVKIRLFFD